eukprot:10476-Heterococcus_DN1.PRE.5
MESSPLVAHTFAYTIMYLYIEQFMPIVQQLVQNFLLDIMIMFLLSASVHLLCDANTLLVC